MAASMFLPFFFLLLSTSCFLSITTTDAQPELPDIDHRVNDLLSKLNSKGYQVMSQALQYSYSQLLVHMYPPYNTEENYTILAPRDKDVNWAISPFFMEESYMIRRKLDKEDLESLPYGTKIDTMHHSYPLMVTTMHNAIDLNTSSLSSPPISNVSVDDVKIVEWSVYEDELVVVHGISNWLNDYYVYLHHINNITNNTIDVKMSSSGRVHQSYVGFPAVICFLLIIVFFDVNQFSFILSQS